MNLLSIFQNFIDFRVVFFIYITLVTVATIQSLPKRNTSENLKGNPYTEYNNFIIFKNSYYHLAAGENMYLSHPEKQHDLYKYSPTFAVFFGGLALLPDYLGLGLWNLTNAILLLFALMKIPETTEKNKVLAGMFVVPELMTSLQNEQSNGLMAGLMILAFVCMEKRMVFLATCFLVGTVYIKIFGLVAFAFLLLYPDRLKTILYVSFWMIVFFIIPLTLTNLDGYIMQLEAWKKMLSEDYSASLGISVMGIFNSWFGWTINKALMISAGIIVFLTGMIRFSRYYEYRYRLLLLASCLLWMVIFNHKAESPTFIIAVAGVAIWYFIPGSIQLLWMKAILIFVFILTSLSPTDIFPAYLRNEYVIPYALKALPCVLVWIAVIWELWQKRTYPEIPAEIN